jgi:hypothetical protein
MVLAWKDMIHVNSSYPNITPSSARIHFQKTQLYDSWESAEALNLKIVYIIPTETSLCLLLPLTNPLLSPTKLWFSY